MKFFARFLLLVAAFALTTAGLMGWKDHGFGFDGLWPLDGDPGLHPLHLLVLGLAMIAPALWEVFLLERDLHEAGAQHADEPRPSEGPP